MLAAERRRLIARRLRREGSVSVARLEEELGISSMTARRDLDELERRGEALRTTVLAADVPASALRRLARAGIDVRAV
jgi:DeoR/GlpR family transcriptional regulator of sugar metabolism